MSQRMNYGPRFRNSIADTRVAYDEQLAKAMREDNAKMQAIRENMPQYKKELWSHKTVVKNKATRSKKVDPIKKARHDAEQRMAEAIRKSVAMIEFAMAELMQTRQFGNEHRLCNQIAIHNTLLLLRTKCGVAFETSENDYRMDLAPTSAEQRHDHSYSDAMWAQKMAREKRMRDIAARLINRPKST